MPTTNPTPRRFLLELGFDLEAAPILGTPADAHVYPLQHALVDMTDESRPKPAWYTKMQPTDLVTMRLLDITDLEHGTWDSGHQDRVPAPETIHVTTTHPKDRDQRLSVLTEPAQWYAKYLVRGVKSPVFSTEDQEFVGWELYPYPGNSRPGVVCSIPAGRRILMAELSMLITLDRYPEKRFVFGPEMIVGPQSTGPGKR